MDNADKEHTDNGRSMVSVRTMEIVTALIMVLFSIVVMVSNYRLGAGWDNNGPESGYFPFYVGVILFISAIAILIGELAKGRVADRESFVSAWPLLRVLKILIPSTLFVIAIAYIGIYVSTAVFIAFFMVWLGRYNLFAAALIGIAIAAALFFTFEVWFLVPLPKGPLEAWLGY